MLKINFVLVLLLLIGGSAFSAENAKINQSICRAGVFKNPNTFFVEQDVKVLVKLACKEIKSKAEAICRAGVYSNFDINFAKESDQIFAASVCSTVETEAEAICLGAYYSNQFAKQSGLQKLVTDAEATCADLK